MLGESSVSIKQSLKHRKLNTRSSFAFTTWCHCTCLWGLFIGLQPSHFTLKRLFCPWFECLQLFTHVRSKLYFPHLNLQFFNFDHQVLLPFGNHILVNFGLQLSSEAYLVVFASFCHLRWLAGSEDEIFWRNQMILGEVKISLIFLQKNFMT